MTERKYHRFPDTQPPIYQRTDVAMEPILGRMPLDTETLVQCKLLPSYSHIRYRISPWEGEGERPLSYESQMKIIQDHKDEVTVIAGENGTDDGSSQATSSDQRKRRRTLSGSKQTTKANSSSNTIAKTSTTTSSSSKAPTMTQSTTNSVARSSSSARQQPQQPPVSIATRSIATQTYDPEDFVEQSSPNTLDTLPTSYEPVCDLNSPPTTAPGTRIVATQTPFFPRQFYTIRPSDSFKVVMLYNSEDLLKPAYFFIEKHEIYDFPSSTIDNHDRIVLNYEMNRKAKTNITEWDLSGWDKCPLCRKSFLKKDVCIMAVERRIKMVPGYGLDLRFLPSCWCESCFVKLSNELELTRKRASLSFIIPRNPVLPVVQQFYSTPFQGMLRSVAFNYFAIFGSIPQKPIRSRRLEAPALDFERRKLTSLHTQGPQPSSYQNQFDSKGRPKCQRGLVVSFGICLSCGKPCKWKCSGCFMAYYCDRSCQKKNWRDHKEFCKQNRKTSAENAQNAGSGDDSGNSGNSGDANVNGNGNGNEDSGNTVSA